MLQPNLSIYKSINLPLDKLLFTLAVIILLLLSPYFVWGNQLLALRLTYFFGNVLILYIIFNHHHSEIYNVELVLFYLVVSIYSMVGGTQDKSITYIPLFSFFFIALKPIEQQRIFAHLITLLTIVFSIGLVSYILSILGLNIQLGTTLAPNPSKDPYLVFFGHVEETGLPIYRFSSIFDESGVVGTVCGLVLSSIGISIRNYKSLIILIAGLVSFSLAFYIILFINMLFYFDIKKSLLIAIVAVLLIFASGNMFRDLIGSRIVIENGRLSGDNRTSMVFNTYYNLFIAKGGNDLIFGLGSGATTKLDEDIIFGISSYKSLIIKYGIIGLGLILGFYVFCTYKYNNSLKGWFLLFIFMISAYQRPDLLKNYSIVIFIGGLSYLTKDYGQANLDNSVTSVL